MRRIAIGASDLKVLDLEFPLELDDGVEDALHDVAIDQMALRFDDFRYGSVAGVSMLLFRITSGLPSTR